MWCNLYVECNISYVCVNIFNINYYDIICYSIVYTHKMHCNYNYYTIIILIRLIITIYNYTLAYTTYIPINGKKMIRASFSFLSMID